MKRIILFVFISLFFVIPVFAANERNVLRFVETDDSLYYEKELIDDYYFMKHLDMVPGKKYIDKLYIENAADDRYLLFFSIDNIDGNLLDNIMMRIYINDELIYNGVSTGQDYYGDTINLQNTVCLGYVNPDDVYEMKVETFLADDFESDGSVDTSTIDWHFYAQYPAVDEPEPLPKPHPIDPDSPVDPHGSDEPVVPDEPIDNPGTGVIEILPIPDTGINGEYNGKLVTISALVGLSFAIIVVLIFRNKKKTV